MKKEYFKNIVKWVRERKTYFLIFEILLIIMLPIIRNLGIDLFICLQKIMLCIFFVFVIADIILYWDGKVKRNNAVFYGFKYLMLGKLMLLTILPFRIMALYSWENFFTILWTYGLVFEVFSDLIKACIGVKINIFYLMLFGLIIHNIANTEANKILFTVILLYLMRWYGSLDSLILYGQGKFRIDKICERDRMILVKRKAISWIAYCSILITYLIKDQTPSNVKGDLMELLGYPIEFLLGFFIEITDNDTVAINSVVVLLCIGITSGVIGWFMWNTIIQRKRRFFMSKLNATNNEMLNRNIRLVKMNRKSRRKIVRKSPRIIRNR